MSQDTQTIRQTAFTACLILPGRVSSIPMEKLAIGLWGLYFGTTVLMLAGSALAFARSLRRVSVNAGVAALVSAFFAVAFLGGLPSSNDATLARFLAQVGCLVAVVLVCGVGVRSARAARCGRRPDDPWSVVRCRDGA